MTVMRILTSVSVERAIPLSSSPYFFLKVPKIVEIYRRKLFISSQFGATDLGRERLDPV